MSVDCTWATADDAWVLADYTWQEACFIADVVGIKGGGYSGQLEKLKRRDKNQQKKFVKLLCRIKGEKYEEVKYFRPNINVRVSDFELLHKEVIKPNLHIFINKEK
tara:strand:- start:23814 stop:24131 length:318 start_codon:yes stop_codon:yes gene_type:complete